MPKNVGGFGLDIPKWRIPNGLLEAFLNFKQIDKSICIIKNMLGIPFFLFGKLPLNIA